MFRANSFIRRIWPFIDPHKLLLAVTFLLIFFASWLSLIPSYLLITLTNNILVPLQNHHLIEHKIIFWVLTGFFGAWLLSWFFSISSSLLSNHINIKINQHIRLKTFNHLISLSIEDLPQLRNGDLINRIGHETQKITGFICNTVPNAIQDFFLIFFIIFFILNISPNLTLIAVTPIPLIVFLGYFLRRKLKILIKQSSYSWSLLIAKLSEVIYGIRIVKCFNQELNESKNFALLTNQFSKFRLATDGMWSIISPSNTLLCNMGILSIWCYGIHLMELGQLSLGALTSFIAYSGRLYGISNSFNYIYQQYQSTVIDLERLYEILEKAPSINLKRQNNVHIPQAIGGFEIRNLNFKYGSRQALYDINLKISPGEKVGIVGYSGAGKTTLINILCRFSDSYLGNVYLDNVDIKHIPLEYYRNQIGIVLQEPFLFYGSIAENIAYSNPNASPEEIIYAAKFAQAHEFILQQPLAYNTLLQEGGISLSGGEKQRIAIARAILANPQILIMDEPVSALDIITEKKIHHAIEHLTKGKTTIVISHRLSSFKNFNKLIFISNGRILEIGNHNDLMSRKSFYYEFYTAQHNQNEEQTTC